MSESELAKFAAEAMHRMPGFTAVINANGQFGLVADWLLAALTPVARAKLTFVSRIHPSRHGRQNNCWKSFSTRAAGSPM
jgi:hypothetical protein